MPDELEKVPFLRPEHGPVPANDLAGRRLSTDNDYLSNRELSDLAKVVSLLAALLTILLGIVFLAHHIHEYHHGHGGTGNLQSEKITRRIWDESFVINPKLDEHKWYYHPYEYVQASTKRVINNPECTTVLI
jgi:hypothetical protein